MSFISSLTNAITGLKEAVREESNFKIHTILAVIAIIFAFFLNFSYLEWIALILTIAFVLVMELFNTVLENIVDIVSPEIREKARIAKDVSAASVLVSAFVAILVGLLLFLPKIISLTNLF